MLNDPRIWGTHLKRREVVMLVCQIHLECIWCIHLNQYMQELACGIHSAYSVAMMHGLSRFNLKATPSLVPTMTDAPSVASPSHLLCLPVLRASHRLPLQ